MSLFQHNYNLINFHLLNQRVRDYQKLKYDEPELIDFFCRIHFCTDLINSLSFIAVNKNLKKDFMIKVR